MAMNLGLYKSIPKKKSRPKKAGISRNKVINLWFLIARYSLLVPGFWLDINEPTTNNQQPTTSNQQPTTNNQQPTTNLWPFK